MARLPSPPASTLTGTCRRLVSLICDKIPVAPVLLKAGHRPSSFECPQVVQEQNWCLGHNIKLVNARSTLNLAKLQDLLQHPGNNNVD